MERSILKELNKKNLQSYLNARLYSEVYFPMFFPMKKTSFLTYETVIGSQNSRIAADIVSYDSSAPLKSRQVVSKLTGEIPPIRIKRAMREKDINEYNVLTANATPDVQAILDLIFNDVDFVYEGVQGRLEWIAMQALSLGSITLDKSNNNGIVTETAIDFGVPSGNKTGVATIWSNTASTPLTDINTLQATARAAGHSLKYMLMRWETWEAFRNTTQVQNASTAGSSILARVPNKADLDAYLRDQGLPEIIIIDQSIGIETDANAISYVNPWSQYKVAFLPEMRCGDYLVGPLASRTNPPVQEIQADRNNVLISKYRTVDPVNEYTRGEINAFPSWNNVDRVYLMNTNNVTTWS